MKSQCYYAMRIIAYYAFLCLCRVSGVACFSILLSLVLRKVLLQCVLGNIKHTLLLEGECSEYSQQNIEFCHSGAEMLFPTCGNMKGVLHE